MKQRHMQMIGLAGELYLSPTRNMFQLMLIGLAGTLGTGLFLGSGKTIRQGGPLGALLAYIQTGSMAYCMCESPSSASTRTDHDNLECSRLMSDPSQ